jgi:hypothetical protein
MTLETQYGVPAVAVHADAFARLVASVTRVNGMPGARRAFVPTPVLNRSPDELRAYIEGDDPVRGRPFMAEVLDALTRSVASDELRGVGLDRSTPRLVEAGPGDDVQRTFRERGWTDQLPVVLPTEERVEAMLTGTSRRPDELIGCLRPTNYREPWSFTVEKVAVNAVMAGAEPEYLPVILALASSGFTARNSSTSSIGTMVVVNGPIRREIGMNAGIGALGPYNHANATIGRAYGLLSQNLQGGSVPGETFMGSQGTPYAFSCVTYAENEEESPWRPYHALQGFAPEQSTASVFAVWGNTWTEGLRESWREKMQAMIGGLEPFLGTTLVLDPIVARELVARGIADQPALIDWIHENVQVPARRYWDTYCARNFIREDADLGIEPFAGYRQAGPDELIPLFETHRIHVVVAGGSTTGQWSAFSGAPLEPRFRLDPSLPPTVSVDSWR